MKRGVVVLRADHGWSSWGPELVAMSPDLVANVRWVAARATDRGISNLRAVCPLRHLSGQRRARLG